MAHKRYVILRAISYKTLMGRLIMPLVTHIAFVLGEDFILLDAMQFFYELLRAKFFCWVRTLGLRIIYFIIGLVFIFSTFLLLTFKLNLKNNN